MKSKTYISKIFIQIVGKGYTDLSLNIGDKLKFDKETGYYRNKKGAFFKKEGIENNPQDYKLKK